MRQRLATLEAIIPTLATRADLAEKIGGVMDSRIGFRPCAVVPWPEPWRMHAAHTEETSE